VETLIVIEKRIWGDVTEAYEQLCDGPQPGITRSQLGYGERRELQMLRVRRTSDQTNAQSGTFTNVAYLEGDERAAAEEFVDQNRALLETIDFSKRNVIESAVNREIYDWILHFLGERKLRKYRSVVCETRRSGIQWVIDRDHFEANPNWRYSTDEPSARVTGYSLRELYDDLGAVITQRDLEAHDSVAGTVQYLLEYYRVAGPFDCEPTTVGDELAVRKQ